jgi:hypothetical protein
MTEEGNAMKLVDIVTSIKDSLVGAKRPALATALRSDGNVVAMAEHFAHVLLQGLARSLTGHANAVDTRRLTAAHLVWLSTLDGRTISRLQSLAERDPGRALREVMTACERQRSSIVKIRGASSRRISPLHRVDPDLDQPVPDHVVGLDEARSMRSR